MKEFDAQLDYHQRMRISLFQLGRNYKWHRTCMCGLLNLLNRQLYFLDRYTSKSSMKLSLLETRLISMIKIDRNYQRWLDICFLSSYKQSTRCYSVTMTSSIRYVINDCRVWATQTSGTHFFGSKTFKLSLQTFVWLYCCKRRKNSSLSLLTR